MYTVSDTIIQLLGQKFKPYAVNRTRNFPNPLVWRYVLPYVRESCHFPNTRYIDKALHTAWGYLKTKPEYLLQRVKALEKGLIHLTQKVRDRVKDFKEDLAREYGYKSYSEVKKAIERVRQKNRENLRRLMEECR